MLVNSEGIVLSTIRYSDSSVIAKIYTEISGLRSFMVRTGKGKSALQRMSLLQPLSLIEMSFDKDGRHRMATPRTIERTHTLNAIPFDTIKTCVALFMAEVVGRAIGEEEENPKLFAFLKSTVLVLDDTTDDVKNFHLKFMLEFSSYLGFSPQMRAGTQRHFDLIEGEFTNAEMLHPHYISGVLVDQFQQLLERPFHQHATISLGNENRRTLLTHLVNYYQLHLEGMKDITSHKILEEVLA